MVVSSASDFPAAVAGIITLADNKEYLLDAAINLTDSIDLNDCLIFAHKKAGASLTYTPTSGSLFVGAEGGSLRNISISAPNGTASVFDIDNVDADKELLLDRVDINSSVSIGTVEGHQDVRFLRVNFSGNTAGITFQDIARRLEVDSPFFDATNTGTEVTLTGTFGSVIFLSGTYNVASGVTGIDISGVTSITTGAIGVPIFLGTGTYINGLNANDHAPLEWSLEANGVTSTTDAIASGEAYITSSAETTVAAQNTPIKVAGTTTLKTDSLLRFDNDGGTSNRLKYLGGETVIRPVRATLSVTSAGNNKLTTFSIAKNGTVDVATEVSRFIGTGSDQGALAVIGQVEFSTGDYVEIWGENNTDAVNFTATKMTMAVG